jgi:hypothetical protein
MIAEGERKVREETEGREEGVAERKGKKKRKAAGARSGRMNRREEESESSPKRGA